MKIHKMGKSTSRVHLVNLHLHIIVFALFMLNFISNSLYCPAQLASKIIFICSY